jgi:hypothetical protein
MKQDDLHFTDDTIGVVCPIFSGELSETVRGFLRKATFETDYLYFILTYGNDQTDAPEKQVQIECKNVSNAGKVRLQYYCLDENRDCELIREDIFTGSDFSTYIKMPLYSTYLLNISNIS